MLHIYYNYNCFYIIYITYNKLVLQCSVNSVYYPITQIYIEKTEK